MNIAKLVPIPKDKVRFILSAFKLVPKNPGCYVLATSEDDILYIGLAKNLYARFIQHLDNPQKTLPTKAGKAIWFYYVIYDSQNLPKLERTWINQYNGIHGQLPILNKINSPIN